MQIKIQITNNDKIFKIIDDVNEFNMIISEYDCHDVTFDEENGMLVVYGLDSYLRDNMLKTDKRIIQIKKLFREVAKEYNAELDELWDEICEQ